ncbi:MAG: DUF1727 domain-containing protein [Erysipelotrichales bacterium]|nr:DUF1727 domain-containing protein [Erysipelotrichales bacterium]
MKSKKKTLRYYLALWVAKLSVVAIRILGRPATNLPGSIALKICPDFFAQIEKPSFVLGVTGTNGKTTTCNLIEDVLRDQGIDFADNHEGGNIDTGILSALIKNTKLSGKKKKDLAVFEFDERSTVKSFPYIEPDILLVTNLFRDSYKRNAHVDFIFNILNRTVPSRTKLILNGEDLISSNLKKGNARVLFGIDTEKHPETPYPNRINDLTDCPECGAKLNYVYRRYNHLGEAHCPVCGFGTKPFDYAVKNVDHVKGLVEIHDHDSDTNLKLLGENLTDVYNTLAAYTALKEYGLSSEKIAASFAKLKITETRYKEIKTSGGSVKGILAKGMNPVAISQVLNFIRSEEGSKEIVLMFEDLEVRAESCENVSWIYDVDFEFINDESLKRIVIVGSRAYDVKMRLLMAGIPEEKLDVVIKDADALSHVTYEGVDHWYVLFDITSTKIGWKLEDEIAKRTGGNNA